MRVVQRANVVGDHVEAEPAALAPERPEGRVVEPDAVFELADGELDHGVAAVVGFEIDGPDHPIGEEAW